MNELQKAFIYQDAKGKITFRQVSSISESEEYLQGLCHAAKSLRTFRKDRILETIDDEEFAEERLEYFRSTNPSPKQKQQRKSVSLLDICFTGFKSADKERLTKLAEDADVIVRKSVTKNLSYLCCGYNAGPKKIEKARKQNVVVFSEEQFTWLLETGEMPES